MQSLLEFAPVLVFCAAYYARGIYVATAALMASMLVLLAVDLVRLRRIPAMHGLSALLVFAFGTATLVLHDHRFIQWKPTVFFWLVSLAFLGSHFVGAQTLVERTLKPLLGAPLQLTRAAWHRLNATSVAFYAALGALNLAVAFHASERIWVNFKVFGLTLAIAAFLAVQLMWLSRRLAPAAGSLTP